MTLPLQTDQVLEGVWVTKARRNFYFFICYINPNIKQGWWQEKICNELQAFYVDLFKGLRPKLVIQAPPQHGKSEMVVLFLAWVFGCNPDLRTIYASFSERLGVRANLRLQRVLDSPRYKRIFPETSINTNNVVTVSSQKLRNREIIEMIGREGYFRNTTVRGSITGEGLDLGVIDDPIKGREEAGSITIRNKTWDWFLDDFFSRFSDNAGFLVILTRWHVDDPVGRMQAHFGDELKTVSYPAIATQDEEHRKAGEPLFPELKSLEFLLERKKVMSSTGWESLYQQNPIIPGGEIIRGEYFGRYTVVPKLKYRKIFADTAQKVKQHNDYSVFEEWGLGEDGKLYLINLMRGKWEAPELTRRAIDMWSLANSRDVATFGRVRKLCVEDKSSGTGLIQDLKRNHRIPIEGIPRHIDKKTRVDDVLGYIESGYVMIPEQAHYVHDFITECESFTADDSHAFDDQVDPLCDAISDMLTRKSRGFFTV